MDNRSELNPARTVLVASTIHWAVASRMAIRFAQAGCRVAALYPSRAHPLASTQSVSSHHHFSLIHARRSLLDAIRSSGAEIVVPCDDVVVRHLHALHGALAATPDGAETARIIERSLGDPAAYALLASRHAVQTAARAEGVEAAESFERNSSTDLESLAQSLPFPWVLKADYTWGGTGVYFVHDLGEARNAFSRAGAPPNLAKGLKQLIVNGNRFWIREFFQPVRGAISVQRPVPGRPANTVASCWQGEVLETISVDVLETSGETGPAAQARLIQDEGMEQTVRRMARRLGLSGFHGFDFMLDEDGTASLIEINSRCAPPCHLNAGPGRDPVGAFCRRWLGVDPTMQAGVHPGPVVAYFPQAWQANPDDPILSTCAYDIPVQDSRLVRRVMQLAQRDRLYLQMKSKVRALLRGGARRG